jgi:hypothetical protein
MSTMQQMARHLLLVVALLCAACALAEAHK